MRVVENMKRALIFSGYNVRAVIAICRLLKAGGLEALIVARDSADPIFKTDYAAWVCFTRHQPALDIALFTEVRSCIKQYDECELVLMPTSEYLNRFALNNQSLLASLGIEIPLNDFALYKALSDKAEFRSLCEQNGIDVPKKVPFNIRSIPFVAKQKCFESGGQKQAKPYLITDKERYSEFKEAENPALYFFEEYVEGTSVYLMLYISETEIVTFSQQNLLQQAQGGSMIAAMKSNFHVGAITKRVSRMLKQKGASGLVMIEFRLNDEGAYMIEANPRFWGPVQFCIDNCPELIWAFFRQCNVVPMAQAVPEARLSKIYLWNGGWQKDLSVSRQIKEHPGSEKLLHQPMPTLLKDDVFCREDTMRLFLSELNMECFT